MEGNAAKARGVWRKPQISHSGGDGRGSGIGGLQQGVWQAACATIAWRVLTHSPATTNSVVCPA